MKPNNIKNNAYVNTKLNFYHYVVSFIKTLAPQSECYLTLKDYVKAMYFDGKHQWARKYTSKRTGLSVSAISDHNMLIEAAGILEIERKLKNSNKFYSKHIDVLAVLFGYLKSASLFILLTNINLSSNNEESINSIANKEILPKRGTSTAILQILSKFTVLEPKTTLCISKKPYKNEILYCQNQYTKHNMNLLFKNTDVPADLPLGKKMYSQLKKVYRSEEDRLADIKRQTVPQSESDIWRNPLNNQQTWFKKEPKKYSEVEHIQHQLIFKENYHKKIPFMADALLVLKKIMESEKKE